MSPSGQGQGNRIPGSSLSLSEGLELALLAGKNVDGHWAQFYVITFGLLGWLTSNFATLDHSQAMVLSGGAIAYYSLNAIATIRAYVILNLIILETAEVAKRASFLSERVRYVVGTRRPRMVLPLRLPITILGHTLAGATVVFMAWRSAKGI